jgi:hypothetical protein
VKVKNLFFRREVPSSRAFYFFCEKVLEIDACPEVEIVFQREGAKKGGRYVLKDKT